MVVTGKMIAKVPVTQTYGLVSDPLATLVAK